MFSKGIRLRIKNPVFQSWLRCMRLGKVFLKCGIYTQNNILKCDCGRDSKGSMVTCRYAVFRFVHFFLQINSLRNSRLRKGFSKEDSLLDRGLESCLLFVPLSSKPGSGLCWASSCFSKISRVLLQTKNSLFI